MILRHGRWIFFINLSYLVLKGAVGAFIVGAFPFLELRSRFGTYRLGHAGTGTGTVKGTGTGFVAKP